MGEPHVRRAATVAGLFAALFLVRFVIDRPTFIGASFLLVVPVVLAALWFGLRGAVVVPFAGALCFFVAEELDPSVEVASHTVVVAALVRGGGLALVGVMVAQLFARQVAITRELEELEATRDALRPTTIAPRPALDLAAHYVPVQDGVGGDFYVAVEGPRGSTVLVVGDVVGKGVLAAQRAVFVRTSLVTFAPFEDDPARLLQLANAALIERAGTSLDYVTAACVVHRPADATIAWALAGHHAPLALGTGRELDPGGAGQPLGLDHELSVSGLSMPLAEDSGVLLYTDGILDAPRRARRALRGRAAERARRRVPRRHGRGGRRAPQGRARRLLAGGGRRRVPARRAQPRRGRLARGGGAGRLRSGWMKKVDPLIALELPAEPHSAKVARDAVAGLDGHLGDVFGDVVLVISELVTNSVRHAGLDASAPLQLSVNVDGDTVRVAVRDPGPGFTPPPAPSDPGHVGGWGLVLVEQLAERWGVEHDGDANVVWCELKRR